MRVQINLAKVRAKALTEQLAAMAEEIKVGEVDYEENSRNYDPEFEKIQDLIVALEAYVNRIERRVSKIEAQKGSSRKSGIDVVNREFQETCSLAMMLTYHIGNALDCLSPATSTIGLWEVDDSKTRKQLADINQTIEALEGYVERFQSAMAKVDDLPSAPTLPAVWLRG